MRRLGILASSLALLLATGLGLHGGEKAGEVARPIDALIVREGVLPASGVGKLSALRVVDPGKLSALEAYFPGYRGRPSNPLAGGWKAGYRIYFRLPDAETICITVSADEAGRSWTVGRGDLATRGDVVRFFSELGL